MEKNSCCDEDGRNTQRKSREALCRLICTDPKKFAACALGSGWHCWPSSWLSCTRIRVRLPNRKVGRPASCNLVSERPICNLRQHFHRNHSPKGSVEIAHYRRRVQPEGTAIYACCERCAKYRCNGRKGIWARDRDTASF